MKSNDGKSYLTDVGDKEQIFRIIQTIPSPKAEPFKQWMAKVARDELEKQLKRTVISKANAKSLRNGLSTNSENEELSK